MCYREVFQTFSQSHLLTPAENNNYSVACHELNSQTLLLLLGTDFLSLYFSVLEGFGFQSFLVVLFCYCFGLPVLVNAPHYHENDMITKEQFGVGAECSTDEPVIHIQLLFYFGFVPSIHKLFIALCISCLELFLTAVQKCSLI